MRAAAAKLERTTLRTSRLLDFCSRKELIAQTGHQPDVWPLVVLKELVDNALDACEEAEVAPEITTTQLRQIRRMVPKSGWNGPIQHAQFWWMRRTVFYKLPTTTPGSTRI